MDSIDNNMQTLLRCMAERNLEELTALFAERVDWYIPGNKAKVPWVGARQSRTEIRDFYRLLWANTDVRSASIDSMLVEDQHAIVLGEFTALMLASGNTVRSFFCIHARWEQGLIVRYRLYEDTYAVSESLTIRDAGS